MAGEKNLIIKEPHSTLRKKAGEVAIKDIDTPRIQRLIQAMKQTLAATPDGVGLAAPQVGYSLKLFIVSEEAEEIDRVERKPKREIAVKILDEKDTPHEKKNWKYYTFINPVVRGFSRKKLERVEGCLSVPGKFGNVKRYEKIKLAAYDEKGNKSSRGYTRFFARVVQHELDHLEGTLFIDKAENIVHDKTNR